MVEPNSHKQTLFRVVQGLLPPFEFGLANAKGLKPHSDKPPVAPPPCSFLALGQAPPPRDTWISLQSGFPCSECEYEGVALAKPQPAQLCEPGLGNCLPGF